MYYLNSFSSLFQGFKYGTFFDQVNSLSNYCLTRQNLVAMQSIMLIETEAGSPFFSYQIQPIENIDSSYLLSSVYLVAGVIGKGVLCTSSSYRTQYKFHQERIHSEAKKIQNLFRKRSRIRKLKLLSTLVFEVRKNRYAKKLELSDELKHTTLRVVKSLVLAGDREQLRMLLNAYFSGETLFSCLLKHAGDPERITPDIANIKDIEAIECDGESMEAIIKLLIFAIYDTQIPLTTVELLFTHALDEMKKLLPLTIFNEIDMTHLRSWANQVNYEPDTWVPFCHGGSLTYLGDFIMNKHNGYWDDQKGQVGIYVYPNDVNVRVATYAAKSKIFSNFDCPARLTGEIQAKHLFAVCNHGEAFLTKDKLREHARNMQLEPLPNLKNQWFYNEWFYNEKDLSDALERLFSVKMLRDELNQIKQLFKESYVRQHETIL